MNTEAYKNMSLLSQTYKCSKKCKTMTLFSQVCLGKYFILNVNFSNMAEGQWGEKGHVVLFVIL